MSDDATITDPVGMFVAATVELMRPLVGEPNEAELTDWLSRKLVSGWDYSPAVASTFVTKVMEMVRNGEADRV